MISKIKSVFLLGIIILAGVTSCQKVIQLDVKDAETNYVIEAELNKGETVHFVNISKTVKFGETNKFPTVSGAVVTLTDNLGTSETLTEVSPGKYATSNYMGVEGRTYTLRVEIEGKVYSASSTMAQQVEFDGIFFINDEFGGNGGKIVIPLRTDPANIKNSYRFDMWVKRADKNLGWERDSMIIIQDDQFSDGLVSAQPIFGTIGAYMPGDSCRATMKCIDRNVYNYFYSLMQNGPGGAATPANPVSNFSGGCLGYFSAQTSQTITLKVE